jgi:hypothetical protein
LLKGLTGEPAWPTLRGRLLLLAAAGADPVAELFAATATRDLASAHDQAAVIDWRIQNVTKVATGGPLPWLPSIPHPIAADPQWGPYLEARSHLVAELADQVRRNGAGEAPVWAAQPHAPVPAELIADIQVWRAANQVDPGDLRPTGPPQLGQATRAWKQQFDKRLATDTQQTGVKCSPQKPPALSRTHSYRNSRKGSATSPGPALTPPTSCDRRPPLDPYPTTTPPQHSGGASSTDYRKRRTRTLQAAGQPQRRDVRPRPHTNGRHRGRARRRLPRSARAAEPRQITTRRSVSIRSVADP